MITPEIGKICDDAARAYGFSERVRKEDRDSLQQLLDKTSELSKKQNLLRVNSTKVTVESNRNQHKYIVTMDFALITGTTSPSILSLKSDFRNLVIANDGRVAVLDSVEFVEKENMFTCKFEFLSHYVHTESARVTHRKSNKTPVPTISKVTAPTYATRQKHTNLNCSAKITPCVVKESVDDDDDDGAGRIEEPKDQPAAESESESVGVDESQLNIKKPTSSWWWRLFSSGEKKSLTQEEMETLKALEYDAKLFEKK
jgi:hypothetical protein